MSHTSMLKKIVTFVRPKYVLCKSMYLSGFGALACFLPFVSVYYNSIGLKSDTIGILTSVLPFVAFIAAPLWALLADQLHKHKVVLVLCSVLSAATGLSLMWFGFVVKRHTLGESPIESEDSPRDIYGYHLVVLLCLVFVLASFNAPIIPLIDAYVMDILGDDSHSYGKQRLWGAVSWGIAAFVVGYLVDIWDMSIIFWAFLAGIVSLLIVIIPLKPRLSSKKLNDQEIELSSSVVPLEEDSNDSATAQNVVIEDGPPISSSDTGMTDILSPTSPKPTLVRSVLAILTPSMLCFLMCVFILGVCMSVIQNFLFLYLQDELHATKTLMGLSVSVTVLPELPFFFYSKQLLHKMGVYGMIVVAQILLTFRIYSYSVIWNAWMVLPIELLHGVIFASLWTAVVFHAASVAPPGLEATAQGLVGAIYSGLGPGVGAIVGGIVYKQFGPIILFRATAVLSIVSLLFFATTFKFIFHIPHPDNKHKGSYTKVKTKGEGLGDDNVEVNCVVVERENSNDDDDDNKSVTHGNNNDSNVRLLSEQTINQ